MDTSKSLTDLIFEMGVLEKDAEETARRLKVSLNIVEPQDLVKTPWKELLFTCTNGTSTVAIPPTIFRVVCAIRYKLANPISERDYDGPSFRSYPLKKILTDLKTTPFKALKIATLFFKADNVFNSKDLINVSETRMKEVLAQCFSENDQISASLALESLRNIRAAAETDQTFTVKDQECTVFISESAMDIFKQIGKGSLSDGINAAARSIWFKENKQYFE